uniref:Uncharacterized protein n=1 Tax=Anguilla anguilla TaxID=7936 RepID=A0A0E9U6R7_ANGAN
MSRSNLRDPYEPIQMTCRSADTGTTYLDLVPLTDRPFSQKVTMSDSKYIFLVHNI